MKLYWLLRIVAASATIVSAAQPFVLGQDNFASTTPTAAVEPLLGHAFARGIHPASQDAVAPNALGGERIGHILGEGCQRPFRR